MSTKHNYPMNTNKELIGYINSTFFINRKFVELKEDTYLFALCKGGILGVLSAKYNVKIREQGNVIKAFKQWYKYQINKKRLAEKKAKLNQRIEDNNNRLLDAIFGEITL